MRVFLIASLFTIGCFREAPPCDSATLDRIKLECPTEEECRRQILERRDVCAERFRSGE